MSFFTNLFKSKGIGSTLISIVVIGALVYIGIFLFKFLFIFIVAGVICYYIHKVYKILKSKFSMKDNVDTVVEENTSFFYDEGEDNDSIVDVEYEEVNNK
ncbi:MAG: hypothetical protein RSB70_00425 [Clostridium sp.]